jgi:hypothetical protein
MQGGPGRKGWGFFKMGRELTCEVVSVVPGRSSAWYVECGKLRRGPYMSDDIALKVAINEARFVSRNGGAAKVSVQDRAGAVRAEYCLCARFSQKSAA